MRSKKAHKVWIINVVSFVLFLLLGTTGLINWLVLPRGFQARGSQLLSVRHFLREIHEWTALLFIVVILIHLMLHWNYIKTNLRK